MTSQTAYDSFGNATGSLATRYGFTGRERDDFTGLMYYRARFYDPKLGRFISEDPIGFSGGDINLYGYVWNNPQAFVDPFGLDGWGNDFADWADRKIEYARRFYQPNPDAVDWNTAVNFIAYTSSGFADMFRVGSGTGYAIYACDENGYGRAAFVTMDIARAAGIAGIVGGVLSKVPTSLPNKGLGTNPFKGSTVPEIDAMFRAREFKLKGSDPLNGAGSYVNPKSGRSYHIDGNHPPPKGPHVGVHRRRGYRKNLDPRDYGF